MPIPEDIDQDAKWICATCDGELDLDYGGMTSLWPHKAKCTSCKKESKWCSGPWEAVAQIGKQVQES